MVGRIVGFAILCLCTGALAVGQTPGRARLSATALLDAYARGQYDVVTADLTQRAGEYPPGPRADYSTDRLLGDLDAAAKRWVPAEGAGAADRRRLIAATVALEISHAYTTLWTRERAPFVLWACSLLRKTPPATTTEAERLWELTSVAALLEYSGFSLLVTGDASAATWLRDYQKLEGPSGHLAHALARFPDEPRLFLAQVEAIDIKTTGFGGLLPNVQNNFTIRSDALPPEAIAHLRRRAADRRDSRDQANAIVALERIATLPEVGNGYAALASHESIRAEVELRFGYLAARVFNTDVAVDHLGRVPALTTDTFLIYLSHYIRGWSLAQAGRRSEAISAYRHALAAVPNVRSAATLLAAQLFQSDESKDRSDAFAVLDAANRADPPVSDPWTQFGRGDARLWPALIVQLRTALR